MNYKEITELFKIENPIGYSDEELEKVKADVGAIPSELEKFYRYCGKSEELHGLQDWLILPNRHKDFIALDYIVFFNENQGVCQAAVKKSDSALDDPPVYTSVDNGEWKLSSPHVSEFLRVMFDYQASLCLEFGSEEFYFITAEEKAKIESLFPKLGEFNYWLYDCKITVYGGNGSRIALTEGSGDIWINYAANNEEEFKRMSALLEGIGEPM